MKRYLIIGLLLLTTPVWAATVVDFEEFMLGSDSHYGGAGSGQTGFISEGVSFMHIDGGYSWEGFSYSNETDIVKGDYENQFSAITGQGAGGSSNYCVGGLGLDWMSGTYDLIPIHLSFGTPVNLSGAYFTNTTYTYWTMKNGNFAADPFDASDYLTLSIHGLDAQNNLMGQISLDLGRGYDLIDSWTWVNLSALGTVSQIEFTVSGNDIGDYGLNTPAYFAMDNLTFVPEPATLLLMGLGGMVLTRKRV